MSERRDGNADAVVICSRKCSNGEDIVGGEDCGGWPPGLDEAVHGLEAGALAEARGHHPDVFPEAMARHRVPGATCPQFRGFGGRAEAGDVVVAEPDQVFDGEARAGDVVVGDDIRRRELQGAGSCDNGRYTRGRPHERGHRAGRPLR